MRGTFLEQTPTEILQVLSWLVTFIAFQLQSLCRKMFFKAYGMKPLGGRREITRHTIKVDHQCRLGCQNN